MTLTDSLKKIAGKFRKAPEQEKVSSGPYSVIFDVSNNSMIAIMTSIPVANVMVETMLDTGFNHGIMSQEVGLLSKQDPRTYPEWSWDMQKRVFKKTHPDLVTEDMRERAVLAAKRVEGLVFAINAINNIRQRVRTGTWFQERIYDQKEAQARLFRESGYDEKLLAKIPYVTQDAEERDISIKESTDDIILHADLFNEYLLRSEKARLSLFRAIKRAKSVKEIDAAIATFRIEGIL